MASIKINNLNPTGSDLLIDSESFLNELVDTELTIQGGCQIQTTTVCDRKSILTWLTLF